mmetsp:Transcript_6033/g.14627  ORF Transcript_6033/g.14627 Transcript_6033/m.14627 type:complete len:96 (+) Transcript_6033:28-315(+)
MLIINFCSTRIITCKYFYRHGSILAQKNRFCPVLLIKSSNSIVANGDSGGWENFHQRNVSCGDCSCCCEETAWAFAWSVTHSIARKRPAGIATNR